jgi:hypothetical protein
MATESLEQRVAALEQAVKDLQQRLANGATSESWLEKVSGCITDKEAFREIVELGRAIRAADRPPDEPHDVQ